jgi:nucleotide-binding universal stress UspA family protein
MVTRQQSEDPQDRAVIDMAGAAAAYAAGDMSAALDQSRAALVHADVLGLRTDSMRWSWFIAARAARGLGDTTALQELVSLVGGHPIGHVPPTMRAEADLLRIRLGSGDEAEGDETFERSIATLRDLPAPYHLAWALLERGREADLAEAAAIAERLGAAPLLERVRELAADGVALSP